MGAVGDPRERITCATCGIEVRVSPSLFVGAIRYCDRCALTPQEQRDIRIDRARGEAIARRRKDAGLPDIFTEIEDRLLAEWDANLEESDGT